MSRFYASDSSDSEEDSSDDDEIGMQQQVGGGNDARFWNESSDEEDEKRVVRSQKDKRFEQMQTTIKSIRNDIKIGDWNAIVKDSETLKKQLSKAKNIVQKEGIPKFFFQIWLAIETFHKESKKLSKDKKKFSKSNSKSYNIMGQKLKADGRKWAEHIEEYKKNPLVEGEEEIVESDERSDDEDKDEDEGEEESVTTKPDSPASDGDEGDEWSDDDWDKDSDSDVDADEGLGDIMNGEVPRSYWLKTTTEEENKTKNKSRKPRVRKEKEKPKLLEQEQKAKKKEEVWTPEKILKKLKETLSQRGKRGADKQKITAVLKTLAKNATVPVTLLKIQTTLVASLFDLNLNRGLFLNLPSWREVAQILFALMISLEKDPSLRLAEDEDVEETLMDGLEDEEKDDALDLGLGKKKKEEKKIRRQSEREEGEKQGLNYVHGNLYSFVYRITQEFTKSLQNIDSSTQAYVDRLKDTLTLVDLIDQAVKYYDRIGKVEMRCKVTILALEQVYYRYNKDADKKNPAKEISPGLKLLPNDEKMNALSGFLFKHGDDRQRTRALLCKIIFYANHNRYEEARDLMLMSHVQDTINDSDVETRVLFNRSLALLGASGFRSGLFREALYCLGDLYQSMRIKELLAQGISSRWYERDSEKAKRERKWQYPYHMHINLDVLEGMHLVSAMFLEVPNIAIHGTDIKRRIISKTFRKLFDHHSRQAFNGSPESTREIIMAATKALRRGDWEKCWAQLERLSMWNLIANKESIMEIVKKRCQEVALKTYLLTYSLHYVSISHISLCEMSGLDEKGVYQIVSKMIDAEQIPGTWDQPSKCLIINTLEPSQLQKAALKYANKVTTFVEQNERMVDPHSGWHKNKDGQQKRGQWAKKNRSSTLRSSWT